MTTQPIVESGMTFGPYPDGRCFYIEKSNTYADIQQGVQMAEYLEQEFGWELVYAYNNEIVVS
jgi:hypothetical protein